MVTALPIQNLPTWVGKVLTLNPPAVFISLVRVALMSTYRQDAPGQAPFNARLCQTFKDHPGANIPLQAACHPIVTNPQLWIAALVWGVGFFVVGLIFFWRAEHVYGRG